MNEQRQISWRAVVRAALLILFTLGLVHGAQAAVTSLTLDGEPGDFIGGGQHLFFTDADGTFSARKNFSNGVGVFFNTPSFNHFWSLDFAAADGQPLAVGAYPLAVRWPFMGPGQPGLSVFGDGRGCNTLTGSFQVLELSFDAAGEVASFRATFEQHCEGGPAALRGEIRFNATIVVELTAPPTIVASPRQNVTFTVSAVDLLGRHVSLAATGLPPGATFFDNGNKTGTFSWTPADGQLGLFTIGFTGDNGQGNSETVFTTITVAEPPPANDDINAATVVSSIPFAATQSTVTATVAADDPFVFCGGRSATVWFSFTPTTNMRIEANTFGSDYGTIVSVFTGTRGALSQLTCGFQSVRFNALAGVTYFFMVSGTGFTSQGGGGNLVFNLLPGPAPLSIVPAVSEFASVVPTSGEVTVRGVVNCSRPAFVNIFGQLRQQHADAVVTGFFSASVFCNGTAPWTASVQTPLAPFHGRAASLFTGGKAEVTGSASAFDFENSEFVQRNFAVPIKLRGRE
jgi:hypothetical protein